MQVISFALGPVQANCFVVMEDHHALVIDPGDVFDIEDIMKKYDIEIDAVLLTHAHFDHIGGVDKIVECCHCPVYLNPAEHDFLEDPRLNASSSFFEHVISHAKPESLHEGIQQIGNFEVECLFCPGHSAGSTVIRVGTVLFTGDVLFQGSIGRTDLPTGNYQEMEMSLSRLCKLNGSFHVCPGHGPFSTLDDEKRWNPYLK